MVPYKSTLLLFILIDHKNIKIIKKKMNSLPNHYKLNIVLYEPQEQFSEGYNQFIIEFKSKLENNS